LIYTHSSVKLVINIKILFIQSSHWLLVKSDLCFLKVKEFHLLVLCYENMLHLIWTQVLFISLKSYFLVIQVISSVLLFPIKILILLADIPFLDSPSLPLFFIHHIVIVYKKFHHFIDFLLAVIFQDPIHIRLIPHDHTYNLRVS